MAGDGVVNFVNGPKSDSYDGLEKASKSPSSKKAYDSGHGLDKVEIKGSILEKGKQIVEMATKKSRNLEDCYLEEMEDISATNSQ
ncbi:hypothetical protein SLE2022_143250 [Rubroshorea leprosula]